MYFLLGILYAFIFAAFLLTVIFTLKLTMYLSEELREYNKLFKCHYCIKLFRKYSFYWENEKNGIDKESVTNCVYCERPYPDLVKHEDSWMKTQPECKRMTLLDFLKLKRAIKELRNLRQEEAELERFMKYNKITKSRKP